MHALILAPGAYMYLEATDIRAGAKAHLVSPIIPLFGYDKCLEFSFSAHGRHIGELNVLDENFNAIFELKTGALNLYY